jgi:hypothetical protein
MKKLMVFYKTFLVCVTCIPILIGCQISDRQNDLSAGKAEVSTRADDCQDCGSDCCCFIQLDGDDAASVLFCGTLDGASACEETSSCGTLTGGGQLIILSVGTPRKLFCGELNGSFYIRNWSTTDEVDVIISCQAEDGTPQTIMVHLEVSPGPGHEFFYSIDSECELDDC